ncbi:polysaccharide deacetylase family protein [Ruminiclostridium herbifermentans]|uniref:Polysaccharide deacetylase family protein n=1 Tax=Ruminiclostridium herbifermentans TaxID=2488810 RepID=A0A4U7JLC8_9FIRM|nr:polysaccharide deacetylase family protein [Ruminiclostridium herbifermentans]QNU68292.1 polysaccharide deacetylase family protein [Ruminiclostridium herbifermentans]
MNKLLKKLNIFQRYRKLNTKKEKKQFILMWITIFTCVFTVIFVGFCISYSINKNKSSQIQLNQYSKLEQEEINQKLNSYLHNIIEKNTEYENQNSSEDLKNDTSESNKIKIDMHENLTETNNIKIRKAINMVEKTTYAAITFDDGYNKEYVEKVLDVLKKNNVKSTFFIIGKVLDAYPEVWKRAINEGHQICNHTQSHQILTDMSSEAIQAEILGWEASAKKVFGEDYLIKMKKEFPFLRLPGGGGAKSDRVLAIAQKNGYKVIGWNLETISSVINPLKNKKTVSEISDRIEQHVVNNCKGGSIILLHFNQYDMGNIEQIVSGLRNRGFELQTISKMVK